MEQPSNALGRLDPAGLSQEPDVKTALGEGLRQSQTERGLARTVQPFDRYEPSPSHLAQGIWPTGRWH